VRIGVAQFRPVAGDVAENLRKHLALIDLAASLQAELLCFPELSLTGYEPTLARKLATTIDDPRLDELQDEADARGMSIAVGAPTRSPQGVLISMIVFQPRHSRIVYSKQQLHADELPFFVQGEGQIILKSAGQSIAPAICYESLQDSHADQAADLGAGIYLASVAKPTRGVERAYAHYPAVARRLRMAVLMANCVGPCDNFVSVGQSAVWNSKGKLLAQLDDEREGIVLFDASSGEAGAAHYLPA
jgi:predicted amidohydrolase